MQDKYVVIETHIMVHLHIMHDIHLINTDMRIRNHVLQQHYAPTKYEAIMDIRSWGAATCTLPPIKNVVTLKFSVAVAQNGYGT